MVQLVKPRNLLFLLPFAIVIACVVVTNTQLFLEETSLLSKAITFDLLITTPLLYYFIIRGRKIPKTTIIPVFILGIVVASLIIPKPHQDYLQLVKEWILPLLEIGVLTYLIITIRKAIKIAKREKDASLDFHDLAKIASIDIFSPKLGSALATELSMIYYGLLSWKKYQKKENEFTYHQSTSTILLLWVFIVLVIIETFAVHLALQNWSSVLAWILTLISIYTVLQMLGIVRSLSKRPIVVEDENLKLRWGFMNEAKIERSNISFLAIQKEEQKKSEGTVFLSPFYGAEGNNICIELEKEATLTKLYGFKSKYRKIFLHVDEPEAFITLLEGETD